MKNVVFAPAAVDDITSIAALMATTERWPLIGFLKDYSIVFACWEKCREPDEKGGTLHRDCEVTQLATM